MPDRRFIHGHNLSLKSHRRNDSKGEHNPMFGKHHTEETKSKMRETFSIRGVSQGERNPFYGGGIQIRAWKDGKYDKRPKPSQNRIGKKFDEIFGQEESANIREKMSVSAKRKCILHPELIAVAVAASMKVFREIGFPAQRLESRLKASVRWRGDNNPHWRGGISSLPYPFEFNKTLKEEVKSRDGCVCQLCRCKDSKRLVIHHIDYDKDNLGLYNLITLCRSCNFKVNTNRVHWINTLGGLLGNAVS